jgi:glycosyltransferase involved in cell wall biosynthesis
LILARKQCRMDSLRIALVVHGRFHGFDLARELLRRGHDVTLFTNYPGYVAGRFGIPVRRSRTFLTHGVLSRLAWKVFPGGLDGIVERTANLAFARWAAAEVLATSWDVVIAFSGVAEETFRGLAGRRTLRVLQRGSAHIAVQRRILEEECRRVGQPVETPSDWIVARESREYELADVIHILSGFAEQSFLEQGIKSSKLFRLALGVDTKRFRAAEPIIAERCRRILAGEPLRVLSVGTFCCRKGALDCVAVVERLAGPHFRFRFAGPVAADAAGLAARIRDRAEFLGKIPQSKLPPEYAWGDVFLLPTLEDGFAVVLNQALAAGLPLIATPNCAGPDLIEEGQNGWLVPVRDPEAIASRLQALDADRSALVKAVGMIGDIHRDCDWSETARQAEGNIQAGLSFRKNAASENGRADT